MYIYIYVYMYMYIYMYKCANIKKHVFVTIEVPNLTQTLILRHQGNVNVLISNFELPWLENRNVTSKYIKNIGCFIEF